MVGRWRMALQDLNYTVGYIRGKQNDIADAMSRLSKNRTPLKLHGTVASLHAIKPISTDKYTLISKCWTWRRTTHNPQPQEDDPSEGRHERCCKNIHPKLPLLSKDVAG